MHYPNPIFKPSYDLKVGLEAAIREAMYAAGWKTAPDHFDLDGWNRFDPEGKGDESAWCKIIVPGEVAAFGDFKHGDGFTPVTVHGSKLSPAELEAKRKEFAAKLAEERAKREAEQQAAALNCAAWFDGLNTAPVTHAYLGKKGIPEYHKLVKVDPTGNLVVSVMDYTVNPPRVQSVQYIGLKDSKQKWTYKGTTIKGGCLYIPGTTDAILIAEGFATGASIHQATGKTVLVTFGKGNLEAIAALAKGWFPTAKIVICGDDDPKMDGSNPGKEAAEKAAKAVGVLTCYPPAPGDFNDLACSKAGPVAVKTIVEKALEGPQFDDFSPFVGTPLQDIETALEIHPRCFVQDYLYADLGIIAAAGGTGKTTLILHEAVCMALARPVWGLPVEKPCKTLFVTAEDKRGMLLARLREIMDDMNLFPVDRLRVAQAIQIVDVTGTIKRLAELDRGGNITLTTVADQIVSANKDNPPDVIVFDPVVSFGPGERLLNDGAQALVLACRRIINGLGCAVRLVSHVSQDAARNGTQDQYAARGGTALVDGSRMVITLASAAPGDSTAPDGFELGEGESGFILTRAKLSYAPPQPRIWIKRTGYAFEHFTEVPKSQGEKAQGDMSRVIAFLVSELKEGRKHTAKSIETGYLSSLGLTQKRLRIALARLLTEGMIAEKDLPEGEKHGGKKTYIAIV